MGYLKIKNTMVISVRVSGAFYDEIRRRAANRKLNINDYLKKALVAYTDWKEPEDGKNGGGCQ